MIAASVPSLVAGAIMYGAVAGLRVAVPGGGLPDAALLPLLAVAGGAGRA